MKRILILTHNILSDNGLEERLKSLDYEVFVSHQLLKRLLAGEEKALVEGLSHMILFSKTIPNEEVLAILSLFEDSPCIFLREEEDLQENTQKEFWQGKGIHGWVSATSAYYQLRENLHQLEEVQRQLLPEEASEPPLFQDLDTLLSRLSKSEQAVMRVLYQSKGVFLRREEIAKEMWSENITTSRLSQVTQLIQKLRQRFEDHGLDKDWIITSWGNGYCLDEQFYAHYPVAEKKALAKKKQSIDASTYTSTGSRKIKTVYGF